MAHVLKITDGTTTVTLTSASTGYLLPNGYVPRSPDITIQEAYSAIEDGGEVYNATFRSVTESAVVQIVGASGAAVQTNNRTLQRLFKQAEERQNNGRAPAVYVQIQMDSDTGEWRSEILSGRVDPNDNVWTEWSNNKADVTISWTRRFFWEDATARSVSMKNDLLSVPSAGGPLWIPKLYYTADTLSFDNATSRINDSAGAIPHNLPHGFKTGMTIWVRSTSGTNDGEYTIDGMTADYIEVAESLTTEAAGTAGTVHIIGPMVNWVDVADTAVTGSLPAPAILTLVNETGASQSIQDIYIGQNVWSTIDADPNPTEFSTVFQGQDSSIGTPTTTHSQAAGGGYGTSVGWSAGQNHTTPQFRWTVDGVDMAYMKGGFFRVMAKFLDAPAATTYAKLRLRLTAAVPLVTVSPPMAEKKLAATTRMQDLGVLQLPPSLMGFDNVIDMALEMTVRDSASGELVLDFLQLMPLDGWRRITQLGGVMLDEDHLVDDGQSGYTYVQTAAGADKVAFHVTEGQPIHLYPGRDQRLYFLLDTSTSTPVSQYWELELSCRPRRLTF